MRLPAAALLLFSGLALATPGGKRPSWVDLGPPVVVSPATPSAPGRPAAGGAPDGARILRLEKTSGGRRDGRLVVAYADASGERTSWDVARGDHPARDVFVRWSADEGATWSDPMNLSRSAGLYSAVTDWNGDGEDEPCWGDTAGASCFSSGDTVVVAWTSRYVPDAGWIWGQVGASTTQGRRSYPDPSTYPRARTAPFWGVFVAVSQDGGATWVRGGAAPPIQLTFASRDAIQLSHRGQGRKWAFVWQEDAAGLESGEAEGPGEGASGAKVSKGTDVWYAWSDDIVARPEMLAATRTPVSDNGRYDATTPDLASSATEPGHGGDPGDGGSGSGGAGEEEDGGSCGGEGSDDGGHETGGGCAGEDGARSARGASRPNLALVKEGAGARALVAYEETKGAEGVLTGKTVNYHAFPYDRPPRHGGAEEIRGEPGTVLTPLSECSRRVRLVAQPADGVSPALAIFWRQGVEGEGAPADVVLKTSATFEPIDVLAAPAVNVSSRTPRADASTLADATSADPFEDARAHRAILRGDFLVVGYSYTPDGGLARWTDLAGYDFWIRRSLDGGRTWLAPQNLSQLPDSSLEVAEPRLMSPSNSGEQDDACFVAVWTLETNVFEGRGVPESRGLQITRTADFGATFTPAVTFAGGDELAVREAQVRVDDSVESVYAVWMQRESLNSVAYARLSVRPPVAEFTVGDRLVGDLDGASGVQRAAFFAVNGTKVRLEFSAPRRDLRLRAELLSPSGVTVARRTIQPGVRPSRVEFRPRDTGIHTLTLAAIDGTAGEVVVRTRAITARSARSSFRLRARRGSDAAEVILPVLPGSVLTARVERPRHPRAPLELSVLGPQGEAIDTSAHEVDVLSGGRQISGLTLADGGIHVLRVSGFWRGRDAARLWVHVDPPETEPKTVALR